MKNRKGISLLEMLISLGIFSFMFVFITQVVRQNQRQARKIKQNIYQNSSFDHVIDLIKKDLNSVSFLFDLNSNFRQNFPIQENLKSQENDLRRRTGSQPFASKNLPVFMSPHFIFKGKESEMEFISYSFAGSPSRDSDLKQWIQVRYFIQSCPSLDKPSSSSCLMRSSNIYWSLEENRPPEESLVLFRAFKSLEFSYLAERGFIDQNWKDSWEFERGLLFPDSSFEFPQELPFPVRVRLKMETETEEFVWVFNVADSLLISWNPFSKEFFNFKKWEKPKESAKKTSESYVQ